LTMQKSTPEEIVAIEFINHDRNIINFVKDQDRFGFFNYDPEKLKPRIGDMLRVTFLEKSRDDKFFKATSVELAGENDTCEAIKDFQGIIKFSNKNGFCFVDDVLIYPQLVKKLGLKDGQEVVGKAVLSYDKKKAVWGWKVFKLIV
jgi:hypothetical protein